MIARNHPHHPHHHHHHHWPPPHHRYLLLFKHYARCEGLSPSLPSDPAKHMLFIFPWPLRTNRQGPLCQHVPNISIGTILFSSLSFPKPMSSHNHIWAERIYAYHYTGFSATREMASHLSSQMEMPSFQVSINVI